MWFLHREAGATSLGSSGGSSTHRRDGSRSSGKITGQQWQHHWAAVVEAALTGETAAVVASSKQYHRAESEGETEYSPDHLTLHDAGSSSSAEHLQHSALNQTNFESI